jgi:hypothetical protein
MGRTLARRQITGICANLKTSFPNFAALRKPLTQTLTLMENKFHRTCSSENTKLPLLSTSGRPRKVTGRPLCCHCSEKVRRERGWEALARAIVPR